MRSSRLTALVLLGGAIVGGLVLDAADESTPTASPTHPPVVAGVAMPAATPESTLSSTWYCAGGTAGAGGLADHVLLIANPTDRPRTATITVLPGTVAAPPVRHRRGAERRDHDDHRRRRATTTTTTTIADDATARPRCELPAQSRIDVAL